MIGHLGKRILNNVIRFREFVSGGRNKDISQLLYKASYCRIIAIHDNVMTWKSFPRYWTFWGKSTCRPLDWTFHTRDHWYQAPMFSLLLFWTSCWISNGVGGDLTRSGDVTHTVAMGHRHDVLLSYCPVSNESGSVIGWNDCDRWNIFIQVFYRLLTIKSQHTLS